MCLYRLLLYTLLLTGVRANGWAGQVDNRWEPAIQAFEAEDVRTPPPTGGILFVGSSSIRMWKLDRWFPGMPVINRGFGGSAVADVNRYFDRIVLPYAPQTVVLYSGDNDIAGGKAPEAVVGDFKTFTAKVWEKLPDTRIVVIAIKPSLARWTLFPKMQEVNRQLQAYASEEKRLEYVDSVTPMLGEDGRPRKDLLMEDGLHLNDAGYAVWTRLVMPHLTPITKQDETKAAVR